MAVTILGVSTLAAAADPYSDAPAYARPVDGGTRRIEPLITTGQQVPLTGDASQNFRMLGIPDGMGVHRAGSVNDRSFKLLVNHEFGNTAGIAFGALPSGARVSEFEVSLQKGGSKSSARVESGKLAFDKVHGPDSGGAYSEVAPATGFGRFCSANLADARVGFDRPIFLSPEESASGATFDSKGGSVVATFGGAAHLLPRFGHAEWENAVVVPFTGAKTVAFILEDAGTLDSQLYMYVGEKDASASDGIGRNGLNNGRLYVFAWDDPAYTSEATFNTKGQNTTGHWAEVDWTLKDTDLQASMGAAGSFDFTRLEDGAADPKTPGVFYFVTTGRSGAPGNPYGKLYRMNFDPADPTGTATLAVLLDGSEGFVSPDNIDVNKHGELVLLEDPNYNLATLGLTRDTYMWIYDVNTGVLTPVAEIDRAAAKAHALAIPGNSNVSGSADAPGGWEFSGVVDAEELLGRGSWLVNVQAHSLRIAPTAETIQGGQILHLVWKPVDATE